MNNYYDLLGVNELYENEYQSPQQVPSQTQSYPKVNYYNNHPNNILSKSFPKPPVFNLNKSNNSNLYEAKEGFIKGNMFENLYQPYNIQNLKKIIPKDQEEELMFRIYETSFAMNDLNLYLDNYPNDTTVIEKYNQYRNQYLEALNIYETRFGPLTLNSDALDTTPWAWLKTKWPWEVGI